MVKRTSVLLILFLFLSFSLTGCESSGGSSPPPPLQPEPITYEKPLSGDKRPVNDIFFDLSGTAAKQREEMERNAGLISWGGALIQSGTPALIPVGALIFASQFYPAWYKVPPARLQLDVAEAEGGGVFGAVRNALTNTVGTALNGVANVVFSVAGAPVTWGIELIYLAFKTQWLAALASEIAKPTVDVWKSIVGPDPFASRLLTLVIFAVCGFLLVYLLRLQFLAILKAIVVAALSLTLAFAYFANAEAVLKGTASVTDALSGAVLSLVGGAAAGGAGGSAASGGSAALDETLKNFGNLMWLNLTGNTWAALQFGTTRPEELVLTDWEYEQIKKNTVFKSNSYDPNTGAPVDPFAAGWIVPGMRADQLLLAYAAVSPCRQELVNVFAAHEAGADHGGHALAPEKLAPGNKWSCIASAGFFFVVAVVFLFFSLVVAGSMIVAQALLLFVALSLPFVFLILMVPESGWSIGYKVGKMALAALMMKLVYGVFLSLVVLAVGVVFRFV